MIRILHGADLHLDSPFSTFEPTRAQAYRAMQRQLPERLVKLANDRGCQLLLLAGDVIFLAAAGGGVLYMVLSFTHFKLRLYYLVGIGLGFSLYSAAIRPLARGIKKKIHKKKRLKKKKH